MTVTLYRNRNHRSPFAEFDRVSSRLNQVFGSSFPPLPVEPTGWVPAVSVEETKDELRLIAELPGIAPQEVEVEVEGGVLSLRGRKEEVQEASEDRRFHLQERRYGSFQRTFTLPRGISHEGIEANFQDGLLSIRLPKAQEAKGRKIEIRTGTENRN